MTSKRNLLVIENNSTGITVASNCMQKCMLLRTHFIAKRLLVFVFVSNRTKTVIVDGLSLILIFAIRNYNLSSDRHVVIAFFLLIWNTHVLFIELDSLYAVFFGQFFHTSFVAIFRFSPNGYRKYVICALYCCCCYC